MDAEWYYVENDTTIGPTTLAGVAEKCRRTDGESCLVWTEGMSDWADATTVPAISKLLRQATLAQHVRRELVEYAQAP